MANMIRQYNDLEGIYPNTEIYSRVSGSKFPERMAVEISRGKPGRDFGIRCSHGWRLRATKDRIPPAEVGFARFERGDIAHFMKDRPVYLAKTNMFTAHPEEIRKGE